MKKGPTTKTVLICKGCVNFGKHGGLYSCSNDIKWYGKIKNNLETPDWCPFLLKTLRKEKLNKINQSA